MKELVQAAARPGRERSKGDTSGRPAKRRSGSVERRTVRPPSDGVGRPDGDEAGTAATGIGPALRAMMAARRVSPSELSERLAQVLDRATLYRIMQGTIPSPRVSTVLALCQALSVSPNELLELAGLYAGDRRTTLTDIELRQSLRELQRLDEDTKLVCLSVLRNVIAARRRDET